MPIYTRTGDAGQTSLFGGKRVPKSEPLVDIYGSIDELNSWVGMISALIPQGDVQKFLQDIQSDLFTIGSVFAGWKARLPAPDLARQSPEGSSRMVDGRRNGGQGDLSMLSKRVKDMEERIDLMEKELSPLTNFILPGGSADGAHIQITRSVCRRVERQIVALSLHETIQPEILMYVNRLSDLFFVLARFINKKEQIEETIWSGIGKTKQ